MSHCHTRPEHAKQLLLLMAQSGAAIGSSNTKAYFCASHTPGLQFLVQHQLIRALPHDSDSYLVLAKGLSCLALIQVAVPGGNIFTYQRSTAPTAHSISPQQILEGKPEDLVSILNQFTRWELQMMLVNQGWQDCSFASKRRLEPLTSEGFRSSQEQGVVQYYFDPQTGIARDYLVCLLLLPRLFRLGLKQFFYFQLNSYYTTLIDAFQCNPSLIEQLRPYQPAVYYKELWQRNKDKKGRSRAQGKKGAHVTGQGFDLDCGDDNLTLWHPGPGPLQPAKHVSRGRGRGRGRGTKRRKGRGRKLKQAASASSEERVYLDDPTDGNSNDGTDGEGASQNETVELKDDEEGGLNVNNHDHKDPEDKAYAMPAEIGVPLGDQAQTNTATNSSSSKVVAEIEVEAEVEDLPQTPSSVLADPQPAVAAAIHHGAEQDSSVYVCSIVLWLLCSTLVSPSPPSCVLKEVDLQLQQPPPSPAESAESRPRPGRKPKPAPTRSTSKAVDLSSRRPTTMFAETTIWAGNDVPIILRSDQGQAT